MEQKVRFKMHKVKKNWVTIGVTALSMVTVAGGTLLADQQIQADEQNPANQSGDSSQELLQETPATTNDAATTVAPTIAADAILLVSISLSQTPLARQQLLQIGQQHLPQTQRQLTPTQIKQHQVQMYNQLQLIRMLQLQIQLTILQQPLQTVQQQRIRKIQKPIHVVVVPW